MSKQEESTHQKTLFNWANLNRRRYPELILLHSIPNGANVTQRNRVRLVLEGLKKGMPDIHLPIPRGSYCSLYLELKSSRGRLSVYQVDALAMLREFGNLCFVSRSIHESIRIIEKYLSGQH